MTSSALDVIGDAGVICKFCRCSSADENPFQHSRVAGAQGAYRPWSKYVKEEGPGGSPVRVLYNPHPDWAVARGADGLLVHAPVSAPTARIFRLTGRA